MVLLFYLYESSKSPGKTCVGKCLIYRQLHNLLACRKLIWLVIVVIVVVSAVLLWSINVLRLLYQLAGWQ